MILKFYIFKEKKTVQSLTLNHSPSFSSSTNKIAMFHIPFKFNCTCPKYQKLKIYTSKVYPL